MSTSPTTDTEATLQHAFAQARAWAGPAVPVVALHIGTEQTGVAIGDGAQAERVLWLPLGSQRTAQHYFQRSPPTPLEMETAIQDVEEHVMPLHALIPHGARLFSTDAGLRDIAGLAGLAPHDMQLSIDAMERCFNRLVAVVEGSSFARQGLPGSNPMAATLLVLREFMHHLRFTEIALARAHR